MTEPRIVTVEVVHAVDMFIDAEFHAAAKYDNKTVLDDSGIYDLHILAARVYALGYAAGALVESVRADNARRRARDKDNTDG